MLYTIVVGDTAGQGHKMQETYYFEVNKTHAEIVAAYERTALVAGVKLSPLPQQVTRRILHCLGESFLLPADIQELQKAGVKIPHAGYMNGRMYMTPQTTAELYLEMAKVSLPSLQYSLLTLPPNPPNMYNIGYGLFDPYNY